MAVNAPNTCKIKSRFMWMMKHRNRKCCDDFWSAANRQLLIASIVTYKRTTKAELSE
jgi:hypothetical protein